MRYFNEPEYSIENIVISEELSTHTVPQSAEPNNCSSCWRKGARMTFETKADRVKGRRVE